MNSSSPYFMLNEEVHKWATPSANEDAAGSIHNKTMLTHQIKRKEAGVPVNWPTPRKSEYKDTGPVGSKSHKHMDDRNYLCAKTKDPEQPKGQLNPDWVCWLMGWPIGWSSLEPITELVWLDWSVDPADVESDLTWPTPRMDHEGGITEAFNDGGGWYRTNKDGVRWGVKLRDAVASAKKAERPSENTSKLSCRSTCLHLAICQRRQYLLSSAMLSRLTSPLLSE